MAKHSDTDKATQHIMAWANRPEWSDEQAAVFEAHLTPVCDRMGIDQEDMAQELEEHGCGGMLFGVMFEDFLSRRLPPGDRNVIDDYLERRAWRETVPGRRYLQQLRDSVLSLYEVVEVSPGRHCDIRDLVRGGKTFRVYERMGTQNLVKWDQLAARVLMMNGKHVFSGGILPVPREASHKLLQLLSQSRESFNKKLSKAPDKEAMRELLSSENLDELFLRQACPAFTSIWLIHTLQRLREPLPEMTNRDGDTLVFTETRFPFLAEQLDAVARRLDATANWEREEASEHAWAWLSEPDAAVVDSKPGSLAFDTLWGGELPINGRLEAKPGVLTLTTNSAERAQRAKEELETLLHGLIGPGLSTLQTAEQLMAENKRQQPRDGNPESKDAIDPEIEAQIIQLTLDQHYHQVLDERIPALDNKTPRQSARSKRGRKKVVEWLKHLENNELRRAASHGQAPYDSSWMWDELKLDKSPDG